jgi:S1-C subfamily serine protease
MKSVAALAFALLLASSAFAQDDERIKRIVDRIEKEIRDSHEKTREEIRAIIRAEIQKSQGRSAPGPDARPARKVYLGISADDLTEADRKVLGSSSGIKVSEVRGPAKEAGIQAGDLLVELDGEAVSEDKLGDLLAKHQPGDTIPAVVLRSKKRLPVKILLAERKD